MIEIKIPKEITEYKEKFLFGLTVRQFIAVAAALAVCVPLYIFGKDYLGDDIAGWLVLLFAAPIFGFGFVKFNGMTFERLVMVLYRQKWAEPQKRKYIELPVFYEWREEIISNEIARQTAFAKRKVKPPAKTRKNHATVQKSEAKTKIPAGKKSEHSEVEIPVFGVGSLNLRWQKKKGCKCEKIKHKQRKGNG